MSNKKYKYKNTTDYDTVLIGIGIVKAGQTVSVDYLINNPNFVLVDNHSKKTKVTRIKRKRK